MGFFSKLFGGKSIEPEIQRSAWQQSLLAHADYDPNLGLGSFSDDFRTQLLHQVLGEAKSSLESGIVKTVDEGVDLRGSVDGAPVRFSVHYPMGDFYRPPEMRCANLLGPFEVYRNHKKIPKQEHAGDPWSFDEERRIFVGKGIFFEGHDNEIALELARWAQLGLQSSVLLAMEQLELRSIRMVESGIILYTELSMHELDDPPEYIGACIALMASLKQAVAHGDWSPATPTTNAQHPSQMTISCSYCSSLFILAAGRNSCPNCGAAAQ